MTCLVMMKSCFFVLTGRTTNVKILLMFVGKLLLKYLKIVEFVKQIFSRTTTQKSTSFRKKKLSIIIEVNKRLFNKICHLKQHC